MNNEKMLCAFGRICRSVINQSDGVSEETWKQSAFNAMKSRSFRTSTRRSVASQYDRKVNQEPTICSIHFRNKNVHIVITRTYCSGLNEREIADYFLTENYFIQKSGHTAIAVCPRCYSPDADSGTYGFCLKSNIPIRSPNAGLFSGTYGFFLSATGFGRLSRLRFDSGASFQLRWMNFSIDA